MKQILLVFLGMTFFLTTTTAQKWMVGYQLFYYQTKNGVQYGETHKRIVVYFNFTQKALETVYRDVDGEAQRIRAIMSDVSITEDTIAFLFFDGKEWYSAALNYQTLKYVAKPLYKESDYYCWDLGEIIE